MTRRAALASGRGHTGDPQMDEVWRQIRALNDQVNGGPFAGGRLIAEEDDGIPGTGLAFAAGTARSIPHRLGRRARGFLEVYGVDVPSANHVRLRPTAHPSGVTSATHVTVTPTASGTCLLLVF